MAFDPTQYGPEVARILALGKNGQRMMPLRSGKCFSDEARQLLATFKPKDLFPDQEEPEATMSGLWLYFSCFEEAFNLLENCETQEGELWRAILHRREPDSGNSAYWFRKVGQHPTYRPLAHAAVRILRRFPGAEFRAGRWDPYAFCAFCDRARQQPGSVQMQAAAEIQLAEWQILFDYCARLTE